MKVEITERDEAGRCAHYSDDLNPRNFKDPLRRLNICTVCHRAIYHIVGRKDPPWSDLNKNEVE